jgi:hypothetical protein
MYKNDYNSHIEFLVVNEIGLMFFFKGVIADAIEKYVGPYLMNFSKDMIETHGTSFSLNNISLRQGVVEDFPFLSIRVGSIGSLKAEVDILHLTTKPYELHLKDVFVVVKPNISTVSEESVLRRERSKLSAKKEELLFTDDLFQELHTV